MKYLSIAVLFLFISCNNNRSSNLTNINNDDTTITSKIIPFELSLPNFNQRSYFMYSNSDTSDFVCSLSENKSTGLITIWLEYLSGRTRLTYFKNNIINDSSAVAQVAVSDSITFLNQFHQTRQLELTLDSINNQFEFNKVSAIICFFDVNTDLKIALSNLINNKYGSNLTSIKNNDIIKLLYQTKFIEELNLTLSKFNRKIENISIDGFSYGPMKNSKFYDFYGTIILKLGKI